MSDNKSTRQHMSGSKRRNSAPSLKVRLARLDQLIKELSIHCTTIENLSKLLVQEMAEKAATHHRHNCLGEETHHLVFAAKKIINARDKYKDALEFVKDCVSLRFNDSHMTKVYHHGFFPPIDYGSVIGDCLRHNTRVTELCLHLDTMFDELDEQNNNDYGLRAIQRKMRDLLQYIARSTALRKVSIFWSKKAVEASTNAMTLASLLVDAIGQNQHIHELTWCAYIPAIAFRNLMLTTTSLKKLCIECLHWQNYSRTEKSMILQSLARNQSLIHLDLYEGDEADWSMTESVLRTLSRGTPNHPPPPLQHLSLLGTGRDDQLRHLIPILQSTTTLKHLELRDFDFVVGHINIVIRGLELHYARTTTSIIRLSLNGCSFDDDAAAAFMQYMQTPIPYNTDGACQHGGALQELCMDVTDVSGDDVTEFAGLPLGWAMVSLVTTASVATMSNAVRPPSTARRGPSRQDTIGSQLRLLSLDRLNAMEGFCEAIKSAAGNIRLPSLCLSPFEEKECSELPQWLPYVTSLEQLHISAVAEDVDIDSIIMALQQSKSLRTVTVTGSAEHVGRRYLNDSHTRRIESICHRNQVLFKLLSRRNHAKWNVVRNSSHRNKRRKLCNSKVHDEKTLLLPSLIQAAKHMPHSRASTIMASLLLLEMEFS